MSCCHSCITTAPTCAMQCRPQLPCVSCTQFECTALQLDYLPPLSCNSSFFSTKLQSSCNQMFPFKPHFVPKCHNLHQLSKFAPNTNKVFPTEPHSNPLSQLNAPPHRDFCTTPPLLTSFTAEVTGSGTREQGSTNSEASWDKNMLNDITIGKY